MGAAARKWSALVVDVVAYEVAHWDDDQMLTHAAYRLIDRSPVAARIAILSAGALITAHLAKILDPRYDILSKGCYLRARPRVRGVVAPR